MTVLDDGAFPADWAPQPGQPNPAPTTPAPVTDGEAAAVIPHAVRLAVAVAHGDPDAAAVAVRRAYEAAGGHWYTVVYCLADLVAAAEGAVIRAEVRTHRTVGAVLDALTERGVLPP